MLVVLLVLASFAAAAQQWVTFQNFTTENGNDVEFFTTPDHTTFVAFASYAGTTFDIYQWASSKEHFVAYQSIPYAACIGVTAFPLEGDTYLAVASINLNSTTLYKYQQQNNKFVAAQTFDVGTPRKWEYFAIKGITFLATTDNIQNVTIVKAVGANFFPFQTLSVSNAQDLFPFVANGSNYLAVANGANEASVVFVYTSSGFEFFQSLPTIQGSDVNAAEIDGNNYLAVASLSNYATVFVLNEANQFVVFQNISSDFECFSVEFYEISGVWFLAVATVGPESAGYQGLSEIYTFDKQSGLFLPYQSLSTSYTEKFDYYDINGHSFLGAAFASGNVSTIYKWV